MEESQTFRIPDVQKGYDRWSSIYDHDNNPMQALEELFFYDTCGSVSGLTVLDLGCGTGRHTQWLADGDAKVTGVDFSNGMLAIAHQKLVDHTVELVNHDLHEPLPFNQRMFDMVVSGLVLVHLRNLNQFFSEIYRVVNESGRAVVSAMHPAMFLRGAQAQFTDPTSGQVIQPGSLPHQLSDIVMAALDAGFYFESLTEYAPDRILAERAPRARKYIGWPMLIIMRLRS